MRQFFTDRNVRRLFVLALFFVLLVVFRHLAVLLVFFVLFERVLGTGATLMKTHLKVPTALGVVLQILVALGAITGLVVLSASLVVPAVPEIQHDLRTQATHLTTWARHHNLGASGHFNTEHVIESGQQYAGNVVLVVINTGRNIIYAVIGLILAVVFLIERKELTEWNESLSPDSPPKILLKYVSYVCDAIAITARLQVIVALVNTLITLPVLLALQLPSIPALMAFLFVMGLIPVVGGIISGAVMGALAYVHKGPAGVAVFAVSTFVLHKIESYYLNPRLTAQHVKLPGFVIITSLILFEHVFGLVGLFISFPALYVAARIRES